MSRNRKSFMTAITAMVQTISSGLLSMVVTGLIIRKYGSDFNGLTATANQLVEMLMLVEGGFTIATNVALFEPYVKKDYDRINGIRNATKNIFNRLGIIFLVCGIAICICYGRFVRSSYSYGFIVLVLIMALIPSFFKLFSSMKWRILYQMEQREYILNGFNIITLGFSNIINIFVVLYGCVPIITRVIVMTAAILNTVLITTCGKKRYHYINTDISPEPSAIKGTKDVFAQKITNAIYNTLPVIYITSGMGTVITSVYMVYYNIFGIVKSILYSILNAPRMGLGELIREEKKERVYKVFEEYEFITFSIMIWFLAIAYSLVLPFIKLYVGASTDTNYINYKFLIILVITVFFEILHVPSGNLLNMSGQFKISKQIQICASVILIVLMFLGRALLGVYGILGAVTVTSMVLCLMEVYAVHEKYFEGKFMVYVKTCTKILAELLILCKANSFFDLSCKTWGNLIVKAIEISVTDIVLLGMMSLICLNHQTKLALTRFKMMVYRI